MFCATRDQVHARPDNGLRLVVMCVCLRIFALDYTKRSALVCLRQPSVYVCAGQQGLCECPLVG